MLIQITDNNTKRFKGAFLIKGAFYTKVLIIK